MNKDIGFSLDPHATDAPHTHDATGDGLTAWEEYRGYWTDGTADSTTPRHHRLSPARKELLVQVSSPEMTSLMAEAGYGPAANTNALSAFNVNEIMQKVAQFYCDPECGAGIDLYWVNRPLKPLPVGIPIDYLNGTGRPDAFSYTDPMFYLQPNSPVCSNELNGMTQIMADGLYRNVYDLPTHNALFAGESQTFMSEIASNRDPSQKGFLVVLFKTRAATVLNNGSVRPIGTPACRAFLDGNTVEQGALILTTMVSEENPFRYGQVHYTEAQFKGYLSWAVVHEIAHLIGCEDNFNASGILMGARTPIESTTASSAELLQINLKNRKGVTQ